MADRNTAEIVTPLAPEPKSNPRPSTDSAMGSPHRAVDLHEVFRMFRRRKFLVMGTVFIMTLLAVIVSYQLTPRYTATVSLMIDPRETKVVDVESVMSGLGTDRSVLFSEIEVLRSRSLANRVVDELDLMNDPEFNARLRLENEGEGWFTGILGGIKGFIVAVISDRKAVPLSPEDAQKRERSKVVNAVLGHMTIVPEGRSYVIGVKFEAESGEKAALIANTIADLYIVEQLEAKFDATRRATEWLNERLEGLRAEVQASERAVAQYREQEGIVQSKDTTVLGQQIAEINTQLIIARTERARAEASLNQVKSLLNKPGGAEAAADVLNAPLIQRLKEQEAEVKRREAEMSSRYGERHPRMIDIRAEAADIHAKIEDEVRKIVNSLQGEVAVARANEGSLRASLQELEKRQSTTGKAEVGLRELEREAEASRTLYESFLGRFKETSEQQGIEQPDTRIISRADAPVDPSFPRRRLIVVLVFVVSLFVAVMLVIVVEQLDKGFRSSEQIEGMANKPSLGLVPMLKRLEQRGQPEEYVVNEPTSSYAEAIRSLRTGLMLANVDKPPKLVLVTSALPSEGKTSVAASLARLSAKDGQAGRTILIDCDLRRPRGTRIFGGDSDQPGLTDVLSGAVDLSTAILKDNLTDLHVLFAGRSVPNPPDLLGSQHMRDVLKVLANNYDMVILDSPPLFAVADSRVLARLVDQVVFVVRWEKSPRNLVLAGIKQLSDMGAPIAGVVLNMVNPRRHAQYGYADSGHYYGAYSKYYSN